MPYAIEMYFDFAAESSIRQLWQQLASVGASSMRDSGARPHVSLAVCNSVDHAAVRILLDRFAAATSPFSLTLLSLGMFPLTEPVVFLAPKVTAELLTFHACFSSAFALVARDCWDHYTPQQWVPHCTLATCLQPHQLGSALDICQTASLPLTCTISEIGLVNFPPVQHLYATALSAPPKT